MDGHLHSNYHEETLGRTCLKAVRRMLPLEMDYNTSRRGKSCKQFATWSVILQALVYLIRAKKKYREKNKEGKHRIIT